MRFPSLPLAFALSSLLAACSGAETGAGDTETLGRQASAVQGGKLDTGTSHNFSVGVANRYGGVCSGTLIAPNLVLTARHCVVQPDGDESVSCSDKFTKSVSASSMFVTTEPNLFRAKNYYAATEIITPEATNFCGNDIAIIILEQSIPASEAQPATPVVQFKMTDAKISGSVTAMGYGITSPSANDSGQRRIRENIGILCIPGSPTLECEGQLAQFSDSPAEFVTEGYVCSGDSGGGAFDQTSFDKGAPYVLGALSRGPQTESKCLAAIYSRTDAHADMIIEAANKAAEQGGYPAPNWTKPLNADGSEPTDTTTCDGETCTDTSATEPAPTPKTTTTTTTGCSTAPVGTSGSSTALLAIAGAALLVGARRRRA